MTFRETPLVDPVLTDSLAIPPGVDQWLREVESEARRLRDQLDEFATSTIRINRLEEVRREIKAFLDDEQKSPLHRILRRPLSHLGHGSPAARAFDAHTSRLFQQVYEVLETQAAAEEVAERLSELIDRHARRMPHFTAAALADQGFASGTITWVRRPTDIRGVRRRLDLVDARLTRLARDLPGSDEDRLLPAGEDRSVNTAELWAALQAKLRDRCRPSRRRSPASEIRLLQARQVRELGRAVALPPPADRPEHVLAEHLADVSLRLGSEVPGPGGDSDLWAALVFAADRARFAAKDSPAWQPRVSTVTDPDRPEVEEDRTTLYVVHIADDFVYISNDFTSPVRLWSRAAREGELVEVRVFGGGEGPISTDRFAADVRPLFGGADTGGPAWYVTRARARLLVLGRYRGGWFGVLRARGAVARVATPPFEGFEGSAKAVRVFGVLSVASADRDASVGRTAAEPVHFLGIDTYEVATATIGYGTAWLRAPHGGGKSLQDALERENALLRAVRRRSAYAAAIPLGRARLHPDGPTGYLYAPPLALRPRDSPLVVDWLRNSLTAILAAVFRTVLTVHDAGYALGVHHLELFAFGMEFTAGAAGQLRPRAVLVAAPHATHFGHTFEMPSRHQRLRPPRHPRLGFDGFPLPVATGGLALPASDAVGLALLFLDTLLTKPLPVFGGGSTSWDALPERVRTYAQLFPAPEWAREMADALGAGGGAAGLMALMSRVVAEDSDTRD